MTTNPRGTELVREAVLAHPDTPSRQLARILRKQHPHVWSSYEAAYNAVRRRRGAHGKKNREDGCVVIGSTPASEFNPLNPLALPASHAKDLEPFLFDGVSRVLSIGDLHLPYHDVPAVTAALQEGIRRQVGGILINGDLVDFHTLSKFDREPDAVSFKEERRIGKEFLAILRRTFPKARIVLKLGNHDERCQHFMMRKAPEIYDEEIHGFDAMFGLPALGIELVQEKRIVMVGKLPVLHGHELPKGISNPVNAARGAFMRTGSIVLINHLHQTSQHTETAPLTHHMITTWSSGCLCGLRPQYAPYNKWNHGFNMIEVEKDGEFLLDNFRIFNGKILP